MKQVRRVAELRAELDAARAAGRTVGFVPTMGSLHEGHLSLIRLASERCDLVVVSVFVNPLQFGVGEDLNAYPRDTEGDLELLEGERVDVGFFPPESEMYPPGSATVVTAGPLGTVFEGADRPGHFEGVCTVVTKLLQAVEPDIAVFGQKDAQQVAVVKQLLRDLLFRTALVVGPVVRDADGLALSSRNAYLSPEERESALALSRALGAGADAYRTTPTPQAAEEAMSEVLRAADGVEVSYARAVDPDTFSDPVSGGGLLLVVAARVGATRLIDNVLIGSPEPRETGT